MKKRYFDSDWRSASSASRRSVISRKFVTTAPTAGSFRDWITEQALSRMAEEGHRAVRVGEDDGVRAVLDERLKQIAGCGLDLRHRSIWRNRGLVMVFNHRSPH